MKNRQAFFLLIVFFIFLSGSGQRLYWIGGDGNYNDPSHWSFSSGGPGAGRVPDAGTDVIFDDRAGSGFVAVNLNIANRAGSLKVLAQSTVIRFTGAADEKLYVSGTLSLSPLARFESSGGVIFSSPHAAANLVDFGINILGCDVDFREGHFRINALHLSDRNTVRFGSGKYEFSNTTLATGNLVNSDRRAVFSLTNTIIKATGKVQIASDENFRQTGSSIHANMGSASGFSVPASFTGSKKINLNNTINSCPGIVISSSPSCSGPCTGTLSIVIPGTCTAGPYDVLVSNGACSSQASTMSISGLTTPTNYIITNACACSLSNYQIIVFDSVGNVAATKNENFLANPITVTGANTSPKCNTSCDGRIQGNIFGSSPFSVTVLPSTVTPNSFTTAAGYTLSNICAGVYSMNITDASGCSSMVTRTLTGPSAISPNAVTQSITCNSFSTGAFSVSPTGGTPNYTVNFSTGATFAIVPGNTVAVTNRPVGAVSATITDANGCSVITSTTITQPASITIVPSQTNITCGGACTGVASVAVSGGGGSFSYTWSASSSTLSSASSLCAGNHVVTIRDNLNCTRTQSFTVTQPTSISITPTISNVVCSGSCTGGATVTASGPAPPITFTWMAPPSGNVISNTSAISSRCAGAYTLLSSAASDPTCIVTNVINITQPPAITLTPVTQSITCRNLCTGGATVNVSGGNGGPFTYSWSPATNTTATSSTLCAGNYTVTVRDASNCARTASFVIIQPAAFAFGITTTSVSCNGGCDGVINASPTGGTAPYTYTLASSTSTSASGSPVFTGLCAGTYTLFVKDNSTSCAQQTTISITQPNPLVGSISTTSITCFGVCNGALAGSASGGSPGYNLSWTTPSGTVSGGVLNGLCPGTYTFNVTDEKGCSAPPATVTLVSPPDITVTITASNGSCFSSCNGALSAAISPAGSYTLNWLNNGFGGNPNTGLCAGIYTLTATNAAGCSKTATAAITTPSVLALTQSVTATRCAGSCDGSATVAATGGVGSYTFQFNTSPAISNTTGIAAGLCAGNYIASVTDGNGCSQSLNFSVSSPAALSAAITGIRNSCSSCTGGATVTASNGTPPYVSYAWTNSVNASVGTGSIVGALCPGNYTVLVTDNRSCTATASVSISQIVIATALSGGTGIQCFGACTGSAVASVSGGQAPYSFTWSPGGQNSGTAVNLCAGNYTVLIRDSNSPSCSSTATINVAQPADITVATSQTNVTCFNSCNGALGASASGGTGPISYSWSPGGQTTPTITGLCTGTYTLRVTDGNGCTKPPTIFTVSAPFPGITATLNPVNPTQCTSPNNGSICVTPGGGNGAYSYTWSPAVGGNTNCVTGLVAGTYSVIISSAACSNTFFTTLSNPAGPTVSAVSLQSVTCPGGSNGAATFSASGAAPFTFTWTPAVSFTTAAATSSASGLSSGTYVIGSTDASQCSTTQTFVISQPLPITISSNVANVQCNGALCNGSIGVTPSGGTGPYSYTWSAGGNGSSVANLCAGTHTLNMRDLNQCPATFTFNIINPPALTLTATSSNVRCNAACNGSAVANASGGTGALSYTWLPVAAFTGSSTATVLNLCPASYTVRATDANGCNTSTVITITEPPVLTATLVSTNETCFNACNGTASLSATGGVAPHVFAWSGGTVTSAAIGSLCAGNYTGTVSDANGCSNAQGFVVSGPPPFTANLTPSHPKCNGACNGSITTVLSGAQGAVTFSWAPAGSGQNPINLCATTYTLRASDSNSCQALSVITLTNPPLLLANVSATNPACEGMCNGIAVSSPTNGTPPLSFSWSPSAATSPSVAGLCEGIHTITVTDANLCAVTQTFTITDPALLNINVSAGPASCGTANGSITAIPVGGTPAYSFTWTSPMPPPIVTNGSVVTNLAAGIYTVQVRDGNNCTNTISIPLSNAGGPLAPITSSNVLCNGACTGAASVGVISGASPPYATPLWVLPTPTVQAFSRTALCAGNYTVELRDNLNCLTYTGTTITQPPPVVLQPTVSLATCNGVCDGSISVGASGGVSPYTFSWTPSISTSSVATNVCSGTYSVVVGYNNGACASPAQVFVIPATSSISLAPPSVAANRCFGDCNGSATVTVIPGGGVPSGPVSLSWSNGQAGNIASGLCNGIYSVTASDAQGCSDTHTIAVTSAPQLSVSAGVTGPSCGRCDGTATVSVSGGSGSTYTLNWTNGTSGPATGNLCAGVYQVQVTDSLNCRLTENVIVNNTSGISGENISITDENCAGSCTGAATVIAIGGTAPVNYMWLASAPVNTGTTAASLCAGNYFVQMTDADGCMRTASLNVKAASTLSISPFVIPPACSPAADGTIRVVVNGGTPGYSYSWSPAVSTSSVLANIGPGSYTVTVTDQGGAGCAKTQVIDVSSSAGPVITAVQRNIDCAGACNGSVAINSASGTPTYSWSNLSSSSSVTGLCSGLVTVTVTEAGCSTVRSFSITESPGIRIQTSLGSISCGDTCDGRITLLPVGGTLPYNFAWAPVPGNNNQLSGLCAGSYTGTVTDVNGCSATASDSIRVRPAIVLSALLTDASCSTVPDGSISVTVSGGTPSFRYQWAGPASFTSSAQSPGGIIAGSYTLEVRDSLNCSADTSFNLSATVVNIAHAGDDIDLCAGASTVLSAASSTGAVSYAWYTLPSAAAISTASLVPVQGSVGSQTFQLVTFASNPLCSDTDEVVLNVFAEPFIDAGSSYTIPVFSTITIGGSPTAFGIETVTWSPAFALNDPYLLNPVATNTTDLTYTVSLAYGKGCLVTDTVRIYVYPEIRITSGFSPNSDGKNDTWIIDYIDQFPDNTVEIFNRWGERLFYSKGYETPFDGRYGGGDLPVGTYYYIIHLNHPSYTRPYIGPLTIFR